MTTRGNEDVHALEVKKDDLFVFDRGPSTAALRDFAQDDRFERKFEI
jgi:hypothetical protein